MSKICSFFGHREIEDIEILKGQFECLVEVLIKDSFTVFLFGGFGEFDALCYQIVSCLKEKYPMLKRVYCVCDERELLKMKSGKPFQKKEYEEIVYFAPSFDYWYKRIYYRNCEMIERSDCVIFYAENRTGSGAYKALRYALRHKKKYINLFKC